MQEFLFEDFFVSDSDPGDRFDLEVNGRTVPVYIRRNISLADVEGAKAKSMKTKINLETGQLEIESFDQNAFTLELIASVIKSWPFTYGDGSPVPITPQNVARMNIQAATALQDLVSKVVAQKGSADSLGPFGSRSGDHS